MSLGVKTANFLIKSPNNDKTKQSAGLFRRTVEYGKELNLSATV